MSLQNKIEKYYNDRTNDIKKIYNLNSNYNYLLKKDNNDRYIIELLDGKDVILKAEYEIIGIYNIFNSVWYTGWNIQFVDSKLVQSSKKVLEFTGKIVSEPSSNYMEKEVYKYIGENGNFYTSAKRIPDIVKYMLYATKGEWILPICHGKDNITCTINNINDNNTIKRIEYLLIKKIYHI